MVFVTVSETYDLSTKVGKMALLGIHTPQSKIIRQCYPGFLMQYKYVRFASCNVTMACASMLPADPLQIGTETGQISPSDMFNPILYRAVSNDSMSTLEGRLQMLRDTQYGVVKGPSVDADNNNVTSADNEKGHFAHFGTKVVGFTISCLFASRSSLPMVFSLRLLILPTPSIWANTSSILTVALTKIPAVSFSAVVNTSDVSVALLSPCPGYPLPVSLRPVSTLVSGMPVTTRPNLPPMPFRPSTLPW